MHIPFVRSFICTLPRPPVRPFARYSGRFHFRSPFSIGFVHERFLRKMECVCLSFLSLQYVCPSLTSLFRLFSSPRFHLNPVKLLQEFSFLILNMNRKMFGP